MTASESRPTKRAINRIALGVILLIACAAAAAIMVSQTSNQSAMAGPPGSREPAGIGARGRIEPEDGVVRVAAPYVGGRPSIVRELRVKEGESVRAGQILAVLDSWDMLAKALRQREAELEVARRRLALLKAGAKPTDLEAQRADIRRLESEYEVAVSDRQRFERLHDTHAVSDAEFEQRRLAAERVRRTLDAAKERLKSLEEVRKEDVEVQSAEIADAAARVELARTELDRMSVRAPADGRVQQIHAHAGEEVGPQGILELGKTDRMFVVAEIYETDIPRVRLGQTARISGELLAAPLSGRVTHIDSQITRSELLANDTSAFADTRVVKVKIQIDDGARVAGLIDGKVDVVIRP